MEQNRGEMRIDRPAAAPAAAGAAALPWRIGDEAAEHRAALLALAEALAEALPAGHDAPVRAAVAELRARMLSVVAVGLPGAGTTELLGALGQVPGLLPALVPPKSAPVVRLQFARPGGPRAGGYVRFFGTSEWERLAAEPGRMRPELGAEARAALGQRLGRLVEEMRTRAYMRLGDRFRALTGEGCRLESATPKEIARYLGAEGLVPDGAPVPERARYADMTRELDLFFPGPPFALPVSLEAAPGIDPDFPIREERSAECLAGADLVLAVVSGDAPLGAETRAALSRLVAEHRGRIAVFVDVTGRKAAGQRADPRALLRAVSEHCARAAEGAEGAEGAEVPVLLGASTAASRALGDLAAAADPARAAAARERLAASGLPALARRLNDLLFWGPALGEAARVAARLEAHAAEEIAALSRDLSIIRGGVGAGPDREARFAAAAEALAEAERRAAAALDTGLSGLWAELRAEALRALREEAKAVLESGADALDALPRRLRAACEALLGRHRQALSDALAEGRAEMAAALAGIGAEPPAEGGLARLSVDLHAVLAPIAETAEAERAASAGRAPPRRGEEGQRRLISPYLQTVEKVVDATTLALSAAAREALSGLGEAHRAHLARYATAAGKADRIDRMEAALAATEAAAARLAAFRTASDPA